MGIYIFNCQNSFIFSYNFSKFGLYYKYSQMNVRDVFRVKYSYKQKPYHLLNGLTFQTFFYSLQLYQIHKQIYQKIITRMRVILKASRLEQIECFQLKNIYTGWSSSQCKQVISHIKKIIKNQKSQRVNALLQLEQFISKSTINQFLAIKLDASDPTQEIKIIKNIIGRVRNMFKIYNDKVIAEAQNKTLENVFLKEVAKDYLKPRTEEQFQKNINQLLEKKKEQFYASTKTPQRGHNSYLQTTNFQTQKSPQAQETEKLLDQLKEMESKLEQKQDKIQLLQYRLLKYQNKSIGHNLSAISAENTQERQKQLEYKLAEKQKQLQAVSECLSKLNNQKQPIQKSGYNIFWIYYDQKKQLERARQTIQKLHKFSGQIPQRLKPWTEKRFLNPDVLELPHELSFFLEQSIEMNMEQKIKSSKMLYRYDEKNSTNFHSYIDGSANILAIARLQNKRFVAAFSSKPFNPNQDQPSNDKGMIFALTQKQIFPLKQGRKPIEYKHCFLTFGLNQLQFVVRSNVLQSKFNQSVTQYDSCGYKNPRQLLFGEDKEQINMQTYEVHSLIFDS